MTGSCPGRAGYGRPMVLSTRPSEHGLYIVMEDLQSRIWMLCNEEVIGVLATSKWFSERFSDEGV